MAISTRLELSLLYNINYSSFLRKSGQIIILNSARDINSTWRSILNFIHNNNLITNSLQQLNLLVYVVPVSGAHVSAPDQPARGAENVMARSSILRGRGSNMITRCSLVASLAALTGEAPQQEAYINYKCVLEDDRHFHVLFYSFDRCSNLATPLYLPGET
jgi:hypothetical protein